MFNFKPERVREPLGAGTFGNVFAYKKNDGDTEWAVKKIYAKDIHRLLSYMQEIVIGFSCDHLSILPLRGYYIEHLNQNDFNIYIKLPRMQDNLLNKIKTLKENILKEDVVIKYSYILACGLDYLHKKRIAHRDIKPSNILIDKEGKLKICDMGAGKFIPETETVSELHDYAGTPFYTAPEIINSEQTLKKRDLFKADIWSLGVVMAELCLHDISFFGKRRMKKEELMRNKLNELENKPYSKELLELIMCLLKDDPEKRMDAAEIKRKLEEKFSNLLVDY